MAASSSTLPVRVIAVFGCPVGACGQATPALTRRLEQALSEARRDPQALLVVSGGVVRGQAEAPFMRDWLVAHGVVATRIIVEAQARDTEENATFTARCLIGSDVSELRLVTDRFHMRRSRVLLAFACRRWLSPRVRIREAPAHDDKPALERLLLAAGELWKTLWSLVQMLWRRRLT